jgi:hypothetical protein
MLGNDSPILRNPAQIPQKRSPIPLKKLINLSLARSKPPTKRINRCFVIRQYILFFKKSKAKTAFKKLLQKPPNYLINS